MINTQPGRALYMQAVNTSSIIKRPAAGGIAKRL